VNARLLGTIAFITSPMLLIASLLFDITNRDPRGEAITLLFVVGWMCSLAALWHFKATGSGVGGKLVLLIEAVGLVLAFGNQVYGIIGQTDESNVLFVITDIAWPLSVTFMLVIGIATIRAQVLSGWLRFTPLLCGFAFLLMIVALGMLGIDPLKTNIFPLYTALTWGLMAYAIRRTADQPAVAQLAPAVSYTR
jgi:hypothetical protein